MNIEKIQIIAMSPLLITAFTSVVVMLSIAWRRHHFFNATLTVVGLNAALVASVYAWQQVTESVMITELMVVDRFALIASGLIIALTLGCATLYHAYLEGVRDNREEMYLLLVIAACGAIVLVSSAHLALVFVGLELMSIPIYGMVGYLYKDKRSLEAALKYLVLSAAASAFMLFGMALVYAKSGSLGFAMLSQLYAAGELQTPLIETGVAMILIGFAFKLSLVPFHLWTPDVYHGAPAPVGAFLATVSKVAVLLVMLRLWVALNLSQVPLFTTLLTVLAIVSIIGGNLLALMQTNVKRLLGYSSIAHLGYLIAAVVASNGLTVETVLIYLLTYGAATLAAFGVTTLMSSPYRGDDAQTLSDIRGMFWQRPFLSAVMTVSVLSLAGVPLTGGFIAKFYVIATTMASELWWLVGALVLGSAIGIYYYLRVMVSLFLAPPGRRRLDAARNWGQQAGGVVTMGLALFILAVGIYPQPLLDFLQ